MEQLNRLRHFRQAIYQYALTRRRDAQQELLDALLLYPAARSFPYLSRAAATEFSVVRCQIHLDRAKPPKAMWLAWLGPRWPVDELWRYYQRRVLLEEAIRFRKQELLWTRPQVQSIEASLVWTALVSLAQWTLPLKLPPHPANDLKIRSARHLQLIGTILLISRLNQ